MWLFWWHFAFDTGLVISIFSVSAGCRPLVFFLIFIHCCPQHDGAPGAYFSPFCQHLCGALFGVDDARPLFILHMPPAKVSCFASDKKFRKELHQRLLFSTERPTRIHKSHAITYFFYNVSFVPQVFSQSHGFSAICLQGPEGVSSPSLALAAPLPPPAATGARVAEPGGAECAAGVAAFEGQVIRSCPGLEDLFLVLTSHNAIIRHNGDCCCYCCWSCCCWSCCCS